MNLCLLAEIHIEIGISILYWEENYIYESLHFLRLLLGKA